MPQHPVDGYVGAHPGKQARLGVEVQDRAVMAVALDHDRVAGRRGFPVGAALFQDFRKGQRELGQAGGSFLSGQQLGQLVPED
jgi:hypothetical protein